MKRYKYKILVVDDEVFNLEAINRAFRKEYVVITTTSPQEALETFKKEAVHLVIADQRMPQMTGVELLEKMKSIDPEPIRIILSAYTDIEYLVNAINRGEVYRYITKPWSPHDLKINVAKALDHYQALQDRLHLLREVEQKNIQLNEKKISLERALAELTEAQKKLIEMERLSIIGKMSEMIIHDLKQPLDIIRSAAETMAKMELDSSERIEFSSMIKSEVDNFLEMIQELLEFSRGSYNLNPETIYLSDFLLLTETRLRSFAQNLDIDIRLVTDEQDGLIEIDRHRFQRALFNLIKNSVDALRVDLPQEEKPRIIIRSHVRENEVHIIVEDNGPGIPAELQKDIFSPFISGRKSGIGLGLAIVDHIVKEHHGSVALTSSEKGSRFLISLPKKSKRVTGETHR